MSSTEIEATFRIQDHWLINGAMGAIIGDSCAALSHFHLNVPPQIPVCTVFAGVAESFVLAWADAKVAGTSVKNRKYFTVIIFSPL
jgi:hypothetical protein